MASDASKQVRAILAETERRRRLWAAMQRAAREAVQAVTAEARRRGIRGQNWLGGEGDLDHVGVSILKHQARQDPKSPRYTHFFLLYGSGTLERPKRGGLYDGYPDLVDDDPRLLREAAVTQLMTSLNTYAQRHRARRR